VFEALTSDRDRAIVALLVSSAARAGELLGMTTVDVDWAGQRIRLVGKRTRQPEWVAVSPDALMWLSRYLARERPQVEPGNGLWLTLRRCHRPLKYQALRAMLLRINDKLGLDLVLHDFRTFVTTMLDAGVSLSDVQIAARHADPRTTVRHDRARKDLDRHPNYVLAAYLASGT
jgi:integrase/recombinase XerD